MTVYTIQVTNHPEALLAPAPVAAVDSWQTLHDGELETEHAAKKAALELAQWYRYVRVFRGRDLGRLWYIPPATCRHQLDLLGDA